MKIIFSGTESQNLLFFPPVLPSPNVIICVSDGVNAVLFTISTNKNKNIEVDYDEKLIVHCYGRIVHKSDIPMFSEGGGKMMHSCL